MQLRIRKAQHIFAVRSARSENLSSRYEMPMRILTLTTLYPNAAQPSHGVFVENRLRAFADRHCGADIRVIAPVPWVPSAAGWIGKYGEYARAPRAESRRGFEVRHPRYFIPPKIGMTYAAQALERCFYREARRLLREGWDFDLVDAHAKRSKFGPPNLDQPNSDRYFIQRKLFTVSLRPCTLPNNRVH